MYIYGRFSFLFLHRLSPPANNAFEARAPKGSGWAARRSAGRTADGQPGGRLGGRPASGRLHACPQIRMMLIPRFLHDLHRGGALHPALQLRK